MLGFILRRTAQCLLLLLAMSFLVFIALHAVGNPVFSFVNPASPPEVIDEVIHNLGLDQPTHVQYLRFVEGVFHGDLGNSYISGRPALQMIVERFPATLELALCALVIGVLVGAPLGIVAGSRPYTPFGRAVEVMSLINVSLPTFWIGLMLIIVFSISLGLLPTGGRGQTAPVLGLASGLVTVDGLRHLILPAINLSLFPMALVVRLTRAGVQESLKTNMVRYARAKGLAPARVLFVYVLKNMLPSLITVLGMVLGGLLAFSVVTETIFSWPGTGKLVVDAIQTSDRPVVVAYLLFTVLIFSLLNFAVDICCALVDPRIALAGGAR